MLSLKDSPKYEAVGNLMGDAGFCVLRFDFTGCGQSPPRSGESLLGARIRDMDAVLDFAEGASWSDGRIGLLGSSLGGYLSLLAAGENPVRVRAAACWAAPFDVSGLRPETPDMEGLHDLFPEGFRLGSPENLQSVRMAGRVLLVHGQEDAVVPWEHSIAIYRRLPDPKQLVLMRTADHQFLDESWRRQALQVSLDWFVRHFDMKPTPP